MFWKPKGILPPGVRRLFALPENRERLVRDADDEIAFHLAMWKAEFRDRGMSESEAEAEAQRRFGDPEAFRTYAAGRAARKARSYRAVEWLTEWAQDLRFAVRQIRRAPGFSAVAVLTLALGIGANTAVFSVVHRLLIAPLPYLNGDRVVALRVVSRGDFARRFTAGLVSISPDAPANPPTELVKAWAERSGSMEMIAGFQNIFLSILPNGQQDTVSHALITANFLPLLGARPAFGRTFRPDEEGAGAGRVAMISHGWWQRAFGGRDDVLGQRVEYEGNPYTIVGVMPPGLTLPMTARALDGLTIPSPDVWLPAKLDSVGTPFGLLRPGLSATEATRELQSIANHVRVDNKPDTLRVRAMRAQDFLAPREVQTIEILFAAVGVLLLIACANVANLLLVRAWTRRGEFAIRIGLGAGRARLIRLVLTESVLLALIAGAIGVVVASQGVRLIVALRPISLDALAAVPIEPAILMWTAGISVLTGILFGGVAAFFVGSRRIVESLRGESRTSSGTRMTGRIRSLLIVLEIALSITLLVGAGLLLRSFAALGETQLGFDPRKLVSIDVLVPPTLVRNDRGEIREAIAQRLRETPGVLDAAVGTLPTAGFRMPGSLVRESATGDQPVASEFMTTWLDSGYFRATRIPLVAGRAPVSRPADLVDGPPFIRLSEEIVVNRALATRMAAGGNVVGRRLRIVGESFGPAAGGPAPIVWSTIVGVAEDVHMPGARGDLQGNQVYAIPQPIFPLALVVRMADVPPDVESVLRRAIQGVNPTLIARRTRIADDYVREAMAPTRFALALLGAFAFVALALSIVGLYASISYSVSHRTREFGIRVALGASPREVMALVIGDGVRLSLYGLVIGLAAAAATTRSLTSLLYAVTPGDPVTFIVIAVVVALIALLASSVPARRAVRLDPVEALRAE